MIKPLFIPLLILLLCTPLSAENPNDLAGVYSIEQPDQPFYNFYLSILEQDSRPAVIICAQGNTGGTDTIGFEYSATMQATKNMNEYGLTLKLVKNIGTPKKYLPPARLTLVVSEKERALTIGKKIFPLTKMTPKSLIYYGGMLDWIKDDIIMVNKDRDTREYYSFHPAAENNIEVYTFTKSNRKKTALKANNWRVTLNPSIDKSYVNDIISFWIDLGYPDATTRRIEFDIERHPVSWLGARLYGKGKKPLRLWHFEPIQEFYLNGDKNTGEELIGYRIDGIEEFRYLSGEYPEGIFLNVDWEKKEIFSHDRKFLITMKIENDFKKLVLRFPDGKEKVFISEH